MWKVVSSCVNFINVSHSKRKSSMGFMNRLHTYIWGWFNVKLYITQSVWHGILFYSFYNWIFIQLVYDSFTGGKFKEMCRLDKCPNEKIKKGIFLSLALCMNVSWNRKMVTICRHRCMKINDFGQASTHELKKSFNDTLFMCGIPA